MREDRLTLEARAALVIKSALKDYQDDDLTLDTIEGETSFLDLVDQIMASIADDESYVSGIKSREDDLSGRKERLKHRIERKRDMIERALLAADMKKLERPEYTLSIRAGSLKLEVINEKSIESKFFKQRDPVLDHVALKEALASGESVIGAHLTNGTPSLAIRRK